MKYDEPELCPEITRDMVLAYLDDRMVQYLTEEEFKLIHDNLAELKKKFGI